MFTFSTMSCRDGWRQARTATVLVCLALSGTLASSVAFAQSPEQLTQIDQMLTATYKPNEPGAVVLIAKDGKPVLRKAYGVADFEKGVTLKPDDVFRIGSVTKPFTALADTAGICPFEDDWMAPDWNEAAFMRVMQVNVLGPINLVRAVLPGMMERKHGRIALCGSIAGWTGGLRAGPHYSASKGGVHALVRWFAQRAAPHHVCVNGVAPGPIDTGMTTGQGYNGSEYPMQRMGEPEEIASMLTYLCSPAASFVSGAIMDVNGGTQMR